MRNKIGSIAIFFLLNLLPLNYAEAGDDWQYWNTVILQHAVDPRLDVHLSMHSRVLNDISVLGVYYASPGLSYQLTEHLVFGLNYKFQRLKLKSVWTNEHRIEIQPIVKWAWDRIKFSLRNRLEYRIVEGKQKWRLRERFKLKRGMNWDGFKFTPFISEEVFYSFKSKELSQTRFIVGASKEITRKFGMDLYYMYRRNKQLGIWSSENTIGTDFFFKF
jgi:uncharacterized protein DUF2490